MLDRTKAPQIVGFEDYQLGFPEKRSASNGIPVFYFNSENLDLLHFIIVIKAGKLYSPAKCVAEMCYQVLKEHRVGESSADFSSLIEGLGASLDVSVTSECVKFFVISPKRNALKVLESVLELLLNPSFAEEDIDAYKNRKINQIRRIRTKVDSRSFQLFYHVLFEKDSVAATIISEELCQNVTRKQLLDFYDLSFRAENVLFFAAGNLDSSLKNSIENLLSKIQNGSALTMASTVAKGEIAKVFFEEMPDCEQSAFILAKRFLNVSHAFDREMTLVVMALGGYFGSRLMQNLREKNGYTYGISAEFHYFGNDEILYVAADVNADVTQKALDESFSEFKRLQSELIDNEELDLVKNYMRGSMLRSVDGPIAYMKSYLSNLLEGFDENEFYLQTEAIMRISPERIRQLAFEHLSPDDFTQIVVGKWIR